MNTGPQNNSAPAIRAALLRWYRKNKRPLPWRKTRDPYRIWVSEVMLQQTQVQTVIPFYERFLRVFPDCRRLAEARFGKVAELWSGLGYYRRARLLHLGARKIVNDFGGRFPPTYDEARQIPGVGDYTASAVLSIAYGGLFAALDGNVARIVARLDQLKGNVSQPAFRRAIELRLKDLISVRNPGDFNQSLMELGQTLCSPHGPHCKACPLKKWCRAYQLGLSEDYPAPRPARAAEPRSLAAAIICNRDRVALIRGLDEGLLEDMWNFPSAFGKTREDALERLQAKLEAMTGSRIKFTPLTGTVRHRITFRSITVALYTAADSGEITAGAFRWTPITRLDRMALSQLARKIGAAAGRTQRRSPGAVPGG
jgi:A/G-specific adenine glycosylase